MGEVEVDAQADRGTRGPAAERLRQLLTTIHHMNSERYVGDAKLHEMVEIAMEEDWDVCVAHMERITGTIGGVIAEGAANGEFRVADVTLAAMCACTGDDAFLPPADDRAMRRQPGPDARPDDRLHTRRACAAQGAAATVTGPCVNGSEGRK